MKVLITGGAGFIGINAAKRFVERGDDVTLYDNLCRPGVRGNVEWLSQLLGPGSFRLIEADVRDAGRLAAAAVGTDVLVHLAGQVAVTTSVLDPRSDFETNALGTFNALEAARRSGSNPIFLFASTNKVYGELDEIVVEEEPTRYRFRDLPHGVPETQPLDFHSPYGCSKGAGDQYVHDFARIYGLRTVVFRQSETKIFWSPGLHPAEATGTFRPRCDSSIGPNSDQTEIVRSGPPPTLNTSPAATSIFSMAAR